LRLAEKDTETEKYEKDVAVKLREGRVNKMVGGLELSSRGS
jgi:hypothetical protein